ncbi:MAG: MFS transporter [Anaerolineae bacterium]|jgi:MFS family permease|nr:MFS transporter [Anaerolineae bacterium]
MQDTASTNKPAISIRLDEFLGGPFDPESDARPGSRRGRRLFWADGLVSNISESFVLNFTNPFALALGATNAQMGIMSALANLAAALALLPGARLDERFASRRQIVVMASVLHRLLLFAIALVPLLFPGGAIYAFIALVAVRSFFSQLGFPAWSAFSADLVPARIRGRYFGSRNIGLGVAALIFTPLAGALAQAIGIPMGYQVGFIVAGLVGFAATAIFARIPEPPRERSAGVAQVEAKQPVWALLRAHPRFAAFSAVAVLWNLSIMVAGPYFSVYIVRNLGASPTQIGLLAAANSLFNIGGQRVWGRVNDVKGAAWVMGLTGLLIPLIPAFYAVAPNPWWLIAVECFSGFAWSGYSLANFNLMLGLAPAEQRARFSAIYQIAVFSASFIGPLLGTVLVGIFDIRLLFWLSFAGRLIASLLFMITVRVRGN